MIKIDLTAKPANPTNSSLRPTGALPTACCPMAVLATSNDS
jgi:hypothetical protein